MLTLFTFGQALPRLPLRIWSRYRHGNKWFADSCDELMLDRTPRESPRFGRTGSGQLEALRVARMAESPSRSRRS
jgi:hypothetical protein